MAASYSSMNYKHHVFPGFDIRYKYPLTTFRLRGAGREGCDGWDQPTKSSESQSVFARNECHTNRFHQTPVAVERNSRAAAQFASPTKTYNELLLRLVIRSSFSTVTAPTDSIKIERLEDKVRDRKQLGNALVNFK